jgi:NadR type nicotinamide-nucleotide adenylyltransferase
MFYNGLVIGKFYPPHKGHKFLIDTAQKMSENLTIIICAKDNETIPGTLRAQWLAHIHPKAKIILINDNKLADDDSEGWAKYTVDILGFVPDAVFTSEDYGDPYAHFMGSIHVLVDKERATIPISGTLVRNNPTKYVKFLEPNVRAYFTRRIVVLGAESTGTTTLAKALAQYYNTVWVPEYGRYFSEGKRFVGYGEGDWTTAEFVAIAQAQAKFEDSLAESSKGIVISDTDAFATAIWHERYLGFRAPEVEAISVNRRVDLYIITGDEIPFEDDGLRDGENIRHELHQLFIQRVIESKKPYIIVQGSVEDRLKTAVEAISKL